MLVLCKILRLFVNTLTDNDKYSLLYRDNLTQPIQILLSQKKRTFYYFFSAFLKSTLNLHRFKKKMTLVADVFPKLASPKKVSRLISVKSRFRGVFKKTWQKGPRTVEIFTTVLLSFFFIPVNINQMEKAYVSGMQNLRTVC